LPPQSAPLILFGIDPDQVIAMTRAVLALFFGACANLTGLGHAWAQAYPAKVVRIVVPTTPGSGADLIGRLVADGLTRALGQQVIVENRGGASSNIGAELVARAAADGYTVLQASTTLAANVSLFRTLSYDLVRDFAPVSLLAVQPHMLSVHPSLPVTSVKGLIALAKARPGVLNYSSAGAGTTTHLAAELFKHMAGLNLVHVPYNGGGAALTGLLTGEVSVYFPPLGNALPLARQGRIRALAVTSAEPFGGTAEHPATYPTVAQEGGLAGYDMVSWYGLVVPAKTPSTAISALHTATLAALKNAEVQKRLTDLGFIAVGSRPDEFGARIRADIARIAAIVKQSGAKAD
jgi:tripartite-type tricarboxylate transporter receptor subunit TctC